MHARTHPGRGGHGTRGGCDARERAPHVISAQPGLRSALSFVCKYGSFLDLDLDPASAESVPVLSTVLGQWPVGSEPGAFADVGAQLGGFVGGIWRRGIPTWSYAARGAGCRRQGSGAASRGTGTVQPLPEGSALGARECSNFGEALPHGLL